MDFLQNGYFDNTLQDWLVAVCIFALLLFALKIVLDLLVGCLSITAVTAAIVVLLQTVDETARPGMPAVSSALSTCWPLFPALPVFLLRVSIFWPPSGSCEYCGFSAS